ARLDNFGLVVNEGRLTVGEGAALLNSGTMRDAGELAVDANGAVTVAGTCDQTASSKGGGGSWPRGPAAVTGGVVHGSGLVGGVLQNQAKITGDGAGGITLSGAVSGIGGFSGKVTFTGSLSPGNSPALVTGETMIFGLTNHLMMELGGSARGSQYDA